MNGERIHRKLPSLPPEAYSSKAARLWATLKDKVKRSNGLFNTHRSSRLSRSLSSPEQRHSANCTKHCCQKKITSRTYYNLINNNETMVLPGLREHPPPAPSDEDIENYRDVVFLNHSGSNYADIEVLQNSNNSELDTLNGVNGLACLAASVQSLHHQGWYWGPLDRTETEAKLKYLPDGSFLVRDSSDDHHLYTLSFKQNNRIMHTRIEFIDGLFSFFSNHVKAKQHGKPTVEELIKSSFYGGLAGKFGSVRGDTVRARTEGIRIQLKHPVSRFTQVRSLQFLCKFALRTNMNRERVSELPLPKHVKEWVAEQEF